MNPLTVQCRCGAVRIVIRAAPIAQFFSIATIANLCTVVLTLPESMPSRFQSRW